MFTASGSSETNIWTGRMTGVDPAIVKGGGTVAATVGIRVQEETVSLGAGF